MVTVRAMQGTVQATQASGPLQVQAVPVRVPLVPVALRAVRVPAPLVPPVVRAVLVARVPRVPVETVPRRG